MAAKTRAKKAALANVGIRKAFEPYERAGFRKTINVYRTNSPPFSEGDLDSDYDVVAEDIELLRDGQLVAVYEFKELRRVKKITTTVLDQEDEQDEQVED